MNKLNEFAAKTLAFELKRLYPEISDFRIINEENRFVFILQICCKNDIAYNLVYANKKDFDNNDFLISGKVAVGDVCFNIGFGFNNTQLMQQYQLRYFFYTGRYISRLSHNTQKTLLEPGQSAPLDLKLNDIINQLSNRDEEEFNNAEWQYFKNSIKRLDIVTGKCGTCENEKNLREEEEDCCDICQECYENISFARARVLDRTIAAVGYLNGTCNDDVKTHMAAFLSIFHPELPKSKVDKLIKEAK